MHLERMDKKTSIASVTISEIRSQIHRLESTIEGNYCYIVGLGLNCKFIDLLFKRLVIIFIKISSLHNFIVLEIIYSQTDTLTEELMELR